MVLFSVLIANYNNGKYIEEAINSVINQTYQNWEIILVDDGSTDNSKEIYGKYINIENIKIYYNETNKGIGQTKRLLCELATGELAAFLDADDALHECALHEMIDAHNLHLDASLICSKFYLCNRSLEIIEAPNYSIPIPDGDTAIHYPPSKVASHFAVFKMSSYKKTSGINVMYPLSEDMDLYYKLEEVGKIKLIDKFLYYYRLHDGSVSQEESKAFQAYLYNIKAKMDACERRNLDSISVLNKAIPNFYKTIREYENSLDYRIGKFLLKPIRIILKAVGYYNGK
jgi:glycosyltransferase involved in cell wall biosynthesis